jgi:ketosteroid isomerase-like protein
MKRMTNLDLSRYAAALALVALSACKSVECREPMACGASLSAADRAGISANSAAWLQAVRAADWNAVAATYAADAMLLPPNEPAISGREAIRQWFAAFPPLVSFDLEDLEVGGCCDVAYVRGTYDLALSLPGAGTVRERGKYIEIRRKQADGSWLKLRDMFSSDQPLPH